jgi:diacylglycerol kinase family enzyme
MAGRLVVVNANAARVRDPGERGQLIARLRSVLGRMDHADPAVVETAAAQEVPGLVERALADGARGVVGVGGDGTLRDLAAAVAEKHVPLGVIPTGTGNQLASALGVPRRPTDAVDALATAVARRVDLGSVELRHPDGSVRTQTFTIGCGAGFDARLMATTPAAWKRRIGQLAYFLQGARLALRLEAAPYRIVLDGRVIELEATIVLVGNMGQLAPGLLQPRLPLVPDDGQLDLIVVRARDPVEGLRGLLDQLWRTSPGRGAGGAGLRLRGSSIRVEPLVAQPLEVDGDHVGEGSLHASVRPSVLEVLVPPR